MMDKVNFGDKLVTPEEKTAPRRRGLLLGRAAAMT